MEITVFISFVIFFGFIIFSALLFYQFNKIHSQLDKGINERLNWLTQQVSERLRDNSQSLQNASVELGSKLESAVKAVSDVHEHLGKLEESHRMIYEVGKDISSLQDLLRTPKIRGGIGEYFLEDLIRQVIPKECFQLQYEFRSKERVDAVIKFGQNLVPIDAKFPLENFRRYIDSNTDKERNEFRRQFITDVKEHIRKISERYIHPDEGTFDFALMYIPAENVYYEAVIKDDEDNRGANKLFQFALERKVIPVSPHTFYAYLCVILLGLKGMAIEKGAKLILQNLDNLRNELNKFYDDFLKVGSHLNNSKSSYEKAEKHLNRFNDKLRQLESPAIEESLQIPE